MINLDRLDVSLTFTITSPLISILTHLQQTDAMPPYVEFLYSTRTGSKSLDSVLFFHRLREIFEGIKSGERKLTLYLTNHNKDLNAKLGNENIQRKAESHNVNYDSYANLPRVLARRPATSYASVVTGRSWDDKHRRMTQRDLLNTIDPDSSRSSAVYICGPPVMTDWAAKVFIDSGLPSNRVFLEKWW